jgi:hypothetical protein
MNWLKSKIKSIRIYFTTKYQVVRVKDVYAIKVRWKGNWYSSCMEGNPIINGTTWTKSFIRSKPLPWHKKKTFKWPETAALWIQKIIQGKVYVDHSTNRIS